MVVTSIIISFQGLVVQTHATRLLEAQIATGGVIDPVANHRLPVEAAFERGEVNACCSRPLCLVVLDFIFNIWHNVSGPRGPNFGALRLWQDLFRRTIFNKIKVHFENNHPSRIHFYKVVCSYSYNLFPLLYLAFNAKL